MKKQLTKDLGGYFKFSNYIHLPKKSISFKYIFGNNFTFKPQLRNTNLHVSSFSLIKFGKDFQTRIRLMEIEKQKEMDIKAREPIITIVNFAFLS